MGGVDQGQRDASEQEADRERQYLANRNLAREILAGDGSTTPSLTSHARTTGAGLARLEAALQQMRRTSGPEVAEVDAMLDRMLQERGIADGGSQVVTTSTKDDVVGQEREV